MTRLSRTKFQFGAILGIAALLSGCVLPEELNADIVMTGYHYNVELDGLLAEPRTVGALAKGETLPPDHDERMKAEEAGSSQYFRLQHCKCAWRHHRRCCCRL